MEIAEVCKTLVINVFWIILAIIAIRILIGVVLVTVGKFIQAFGSEKKG